MNIASSAQLAQAAYASLSGGMSGPVLVDALRTPQGAFTLAQATQFASNQTVLLQYNDDAVGAGGTGSSLSLTVFQGNDGRLTLAIRGTLEGGDFAPTDSMLATRGAGYDQIAALYNWWQRVSAPAGTQVAQYRVRTIDLADPTPTDSLLPLYTLPSMGSNQVVVLERIADVSATGDLIPALAADGDHKLDVTGHSLGGHLAMAFAALFPSATASVTTFNAPGFTEATINQTFFNRLGGVVPTQESVGAITTNVVANHTRESDVPWQGIAMLHSRPGTAVNVPIEEQSLTGGEPAVPSALNHSQMILADALAVYALFEQLHADLSAEAFGSLLGAAANQEHAGLEELIGSLRSMLRLGRANIVAGNDQREALHQAIEQIKDWIESQGIAGQVRIELSGQSLAGRAREDFSALASLITLSPVTLTALDVTAQATLDAALQSAWIDVHAQWQADAALSVDERLAGMATFSDQWLTDRATLLNAIVAHNVRNGDGVAYVPTLPTDRAYEFHYIDGTGAEQILIAENTARLGGNTRPVPRQQVYFGGSGNDSFTADPNNGRGARMFGGDGNDTLDGADKDDYLEGNDGNDVLNGGTGSDALLGGAGNDTLDGGAGNDWLYGGAGHDTYVLDLSASTTPHTDTIIDTDGQGRIQVTLPSGQTLTLDGGRSTGPDTWRSDDGLVTYRLSTQADGSRSLTIGVAGATLHVLHYDRSLPSLGLVLQDAASPPEPEYGRQIYGDLQWATPAREDDLGNRVTTGAPAPGTDDTLYDSVGNDEIDAGSGSDEIRAERGGRDWIRAAAGRDRVNGGAGDDLIEGGHDSDVLMGGSGNDLLYGRQRQSLEDVLARTQASSSDQANLIDGGAGDDVVVGDDAADVLFGGEGHDVIVGGAGDDDLSGDETLIYADREQWYATRHVVEGSGNSSRTYVRTLYAADTGMAESPGNDSLWGGAGRDLLRGNDGEDLLDGGADDDVLWGGTGHDLLFGGSGSDTLMGDGSPHNQSLLDYSPPEEHGNDYLDGGEGDDLLLGHGGSDHLMGGAGNDELQGDASQTALAVQFHGEDLLDGGEGNDRLFGHGGNDTLMGGTGSDELHGDELQPTLGGAYHGNDQLEGGSGDDVLYGGGGRDTLRGGLDHDWLEGDYHPDVLDAEFHGRDELHGGDGNDTMLGQGGNDILNGDGGDDLLHGDDDNLDAAHHGDDVLFGGHGSDSLLGGAGHDRLDGGDGNDQLYGGEGNDTLVGGDGVDYLSGGSGDDVYVLSASDTPIVSQVNETIHDTQGNNVIRLSGTSPSQLRFGTNVSGSLMVSFDEQRGFAIANSWSSNFRFELDGGASYNIDEVMGVHYTASIAMEASAETPYLWGGSAADRLGTGESTQGVVLCGGRGDDHYALSSLHGSTVRYRSGDGLDSLAFNAQPRVGLNVLELGQGVTSSSVGLVKESMQDAFTLSIGAAGGITFLTNQSLVHQQQGPFDVLRFADGSTLSWGDLVSRGVLLRTDSNPGIHGTSVNDRYVGNHEDRAVFSEGGDDALIAGSGQEILDPGWGNDILRFSSGFGNDIVDLRSAGNEDSDVLQFDATLESEQATCFRNGDDLTIRFGNGADSVRVIGFFSHPGEVRIEFANGPHWTSATVPLAPPVAFGTTGADHVLLGDDDDLYDALAGDDTVDGRGGHDVLMGGAGNDSLLGGVGNDTLIGGAGRDTLLGGAGQDVLEDYSGEEDVLDGGAGADVFRVGGVGHPQHAVNQSVRVIGSGDGDILELHPDVRPEHVSVQPNWDDTGLILTIRHPERHGNYSITLVDQTRYGRPAVQAVRFSSEPDVVWTAADLLNKLYVGGRGSDSLFGSNYRSDAMWGAEGNDTLRGLGGDDALVGGRGHDVLDGGTGSDLYELGLGDGVDAIVEYAGQGFDRLRLGAGITPEDVELIRTSDRPAEHGVPGDSLIVRLRHDGTEAWLASYFGQSDGSVEVIEFQDGTQWRYADVINRLESAPLATADTLTGTLSDDVHTVDHILDVVQESADGGLDTVRSSVSYALPAHVERLELVGNLGLRGTGNSGNNVLIGNDGHNVLNGAGGRDTLAGGLGNDQYLAVRTQFSDPLFSSDSWFSLAMPLPVTILEDADGGHDTLITNAYRVQLADHVEDLVLSGPFSNSISYYRSEVHTIYHQYNGNDIDNVIDASALHGIVADSTWYAQHNVVIDGGQGADTMIGARGNNLYFVDNPDDIVIELGVSPLGMQTSTRDRVASSVTYTLGDNLEELELVGSDAIAGTGNWLDNILDGSTNSASNVLAGKTGNDVYRLGIGDVVVEQDGEGVDTIEVIHAASEMTTIDLARWEHVENLTVRASTVTTMLGTRGDNVLIGNGTGQVIEGMSGDDVIYDTGTGVSTGADHLLGGAGNDVLHSQGGRDILDGGQGNDRIHLYTNSQGRAEQSIVLTANSGQDEIHYIGFRTNWNPAERNARVVLDAEVDARRLRVERGGHDLMISIEGTDAATTIKNVFGSESSVDPISPVNRIEFAGSFLELSSLLMMVGRNGPVDTTDLADVAVSDFSGGSVYAGGGDDYLAGQGGNDYLHGGVGSDTLIGGWGADTLVGDVGDDMLIGGAGGDEYRLSLGWGHDVINELHSMTTDMSQLWMATTDDDGSIDEVVFDSDVRPEDLAFSFSGPLSDLVIRHRENGDTLLITGSSFYDESASVERFRFADGTVLGWSDIKDRALLVRGTSGADYLVAYLQGSKIFGLEGDDELITYVGNCELYGGAGNDRLEGYSWGEETCRLFGEEGNDHLLGSEGSDHLDGGSGSDLMEGGWGDDLYVVDNALDQAIESAGGGHDVVESWVSWILSNNVEDLRLLGSAPLHGTGNGLSNVLTGNASNNLLAGGGGADALWGEGGDDTLDGGVGSDTMYGGAGDDTYVVERAGDVVVEYAGEGVDTVRSSVSYTLGAHIENLVLTGTSGLSGAGNELNNVLTGSSGNNTLTGGAGDDHLDGGAGSDTMRGGRGNDTYVVERTGDIVTENANEGIDTVRSSITYTLGANVENLSLTGSANLNGTGNVLDNALIGNTGHNTLAGGAGNDTYEGGAGNDVLSDTSTTSNDIYRWGRGHGADTVTDAGGTDRLDVLEGVDAEQIWLRRSGNHLEVSVIGTSDRFTISNWYTNSFNRIESFQLSNGRALASTQVQALVDAMASFAPPAAGQTTLPPNYQSSLGGVIASSWS